MLICACAHGVKSEISLDTGLESHFQTPILLLFQNFWIRIRVRC